MSSPQETISFPTGLRVEMRRWRKRSRQRVRDQVALLAFGAETRMRSSTRGYPLWPGARKAPATGRIQMRKTNVLRRHFRLAARGRSIQMGQLRSCRDVGLLLVRVGTRTESGLETKRRRPLTAEPAPSLLTSIPQHSPMKPRT